MQVIISNNVGEFGEYLQSRVEVNFKQTKGNTINPFFMVFISYFLYYFWVEDKSYQGAVKNLLTNIVKWKPGIAMLTRRNISCEKVDMRVWEGRWLLNCQNWLK